MGELGNLILLIAFKNFFPQKQHGHQKKCQGQGIAFSIGKTGEHDKHKHDSAAADNGYTKKNKVDCCGGQHCEDNHHE